MKYFFTLILFISSLIHSHCQTNNLVVFVGENVSFSKIKISYLKIDTLSGLSIDTVFTFGEKTQKITTDTVFIMGPSSKQMDVATCKILNLFQGNLKEKNISFVVPDKNDKTYLLSHNHVLLFLIEKNGDYHLLKNQLTDVFLTKKDRWASPYSYEDYKFFGKCHIGIKLHKIKFKEKPIYDLNNYTTENIAKRYPSPYYKINNNKATAIYGNYVEDLIEVKMKGILESMQHPSN
jgi:hypothetical protein